jgi:hypothetical protein
MLWEFCFHNAERVQSQSNAAAEQTAKPKAARI